MSSMEVNVDMLEQMDLMDMSDHEALDVFLHSGGEDNSAVSPVTGRYLTKFIQTTIIHTIIISKDLLKKKICDLED